MKTHWLLQVLVLFGVSSLAYGAETHFVHLVPVEGVKFQAIPEEYTYSMGGEVRATAEGQRQVPLTVENVGTFFKKPIDSAEKATELCQLLHWGTLVESKDAFDRVLALYREKGLVLVRGAEEATVLHFVRVNDGEMIFEPLTKKTPEGFEVAFTACVLDFGRGFAGGWMSITRYQYTVAGDGRVVRKEADVRAARERRALPFDRYLDGPSLVPMELSPEEEYENQKAYQKAIQKFVRRRKELIEGIYAICPNLIPAGIHVKARKR